MRGLVWVYHCMGVFVSVVVSICGKTSDSMCLFVAALTTLRIASAHCLSRCWG